MNRKKITILLIIIFFILVISNTYISEERSINSYKFICPETYQDSKKLDDDTYKFVKNYMDKNPTSTVEDLATYRYSLLVKNNCQKTLENIDKNIATTTSN